MTVISEIFEIPESVHQGDFVLRLTEGVNRPEETIRDYVVTPQLVVCFEQALSLIKGALESGSSKGAYLHGSFGSGKSHFMAVLTLLLDNNPDARSIPELAEVVARSNAWTQGCKFLVVPYHMNRRHQHGVRPLGSLRRVHSEAASGRTDTRLLPRRCAFRGRQAAPGEDG
jgi:hypothetical protein